MNQDKLRETWVVYDGLGYPIYTACDSKMCHDHITDMLELEIDGAAECVVRKVVVEALAASKPEQSQDKLREAAQQALEALINFARFQSMMIDGPDVSDRMFAEDYAEVAFLQGAKAIPLLREALAASKPEPQAQAGEPEVMKWPDAPQTIYLQVCAEDDGECHTPFHEHTEVTWCEDKINDSDIKYVRDETIAKKDAALKACVEALFAASPDDKDQWQAAITQAQEAMK